jgi:hypothetical protein
MTMKFDSGRALTIYAGALTAAAIWMGLTAAAPASRSAQFDTIDVGRINVREPDGTLLMTITRARTGAWPACCSSTMKAPRTAA